MCSLCRTESAGDHKRGRYKSIGSPLHSLWRYHRSADRQESNPPAGASTKAPSHSDLRKRPVEKEASASLLSARHTADRFRSTPR